MLDRVKCNIYIEYYFIFIIGKLLIYRTLAKEIKHQPMKYIRAIHS